MNRYTFLLFVMIIGFITVACSVLENTDRRVISEHSFAFAPDSVLKAITNGEEGIFSPIASDSQPSEEHTQLMAWEQADYLQITDAFHKFVWSDSIYDWRLNYMSFSTLCDQLDSGFQSASFSFIQEKSKDSESSEIEHQIDIYPKRKQIKAWEFAYDARLFRGESLQLTSAMLTAQEALRIADNNGGLEKRTAIDNDCEVSVILSQNSMSDFEWKVLYSPEVFSMTIDPITGKPAE